MNHPLCVIGKVCLERNFRVTPEVFRILRCLRIGRRLPTGRGTRAGRLHRIWHCPTPQLAQPASIAHHKHVPDMLSLCSAISAPPKVSDDALRVCMINSQSVNPVGKAELISDYLIENHLDMMLITETWLRPDDESKCKQLTPDGYLTASFPRLTGVGGGIAIICKQYLHAVSSFSDNLPFPHTTFEAVELTVTTSTTLSFLCIYRPPPKF
jgi:hypothetical protein